MTASWRSNNKDPYPFVTTHKSPIDPGSVEDRMNAQLDWESRTRSVAPKAFNLPAEAVGSRLSQKARELVKPLAKVAAVGALGAGIVAGIAYASNGETRGIDERQRTPIEEPQTLHLQDGRQVTVFPQVKR